MSDNPAGTDPATDPDADPTTDPVTDPPADAPADPETDDPRVTRANRQAAQYRTQLRETEGKVTALEGKLSALAQALNPDAANDADPTEALATITGEAESLRSENTTLRAELTVHTLAAEHGGNPNALLDSRSFLNTLQALDANAADYRDQVADAIKSAVESNANLTASGPAPARGGAPGAGQGSAGSGGVTQEQFDAMGIAARNELFQTDPDTYRRLAGN